MSLSNRTNELWKASLSARSLESRIQLVPRAVGTIVALALAVAIGGQLLASRPLAALRDDAYPAVYDARMLASTLAEVHGELSRGESGVDHELRLDSLARQFHTIARSGHGSGMPAADARFGDYLIQARRASLGIQGADEPGARVGVTADESYRSLALLLASNATRAEHAVSDELAAAQAVQRAVTAVLVLSGAVALLLVLALGMAMRASVTDWIDGVAGTVDALAAGELSMIIRDSDEDAPGRLNGSLRRMARQLRENSETAQALAAGAYRRATRTTEPHDPIGVALAQLTSNMSEIATINRRIARGDLHVTVSAQSPEDGFGHAYAAMTRRVTTTLLDIEVTRSTMTAMINSMRGDAAALASSANVDAERLRRTEERLTSVALQARADVARGSALADRVVESESMLDQGSVALQSSLDGLHDVLRRSDGVQQLARNAGLLAVRGHVTADGLVKEDPAIHADEARLLARQAAAASSTITRIMIDGTEHAYEAGVAFDRVVHAVKDGTTLVREMGAASRRQATDLLEIDEAVSQVYRTTTNSAETARQLVGRLDSLASQARRLEAVIRRAAKGQAPVIVAMTSSNNAGAVLQGTPPHAHLAFPSLRAVRS